MPAPTSVPHASNSERGPCEASLELDYVIRHVFLPADPFSESVEKKELSEDDLVDPHRFTTLPKPIGNGELLVRAAHTAAQTFVDIIDDILKPQWFPITKMLNNLRVFLRDDLSYDQVVSQLGGMGTGDILVFINEVQGAAAVFEKQDGCILYRSYEKTKILMKFPFPFPGSTLDGFHPASDIRIPDEVFHNPFFRSELANILLHRIKSPRFLTGILRGVGHGTKVHHIIECIRSHYKLRISERSLLLLLVKVTTRTFLGPGDLGRVHYKVFMLCFMCNLAMDTIEANLSSCLLHAASCKILRRLSKLGTSAPNWLRDSVLKVNACLRNTLEARWTEVQAAQPSPSLWKPSQLDLDSDSRLSLLRSKKYICTSLASHDSQSRVFPFTPPYLPRGTLANFLSSNGTLFEQARHVDLYVALYDVERSVEQGIDDWVASVTDVEQACIQVKVLMDAYLTHAIEAYKDNLGHTSIMLLTGVALWVALDNLVVRAVPTFAECCPGIERELLHGPLLGETTNLHRLRRVYQYLSARYAYLPQRPSVSDPIKDIFAVQYYNKTQNHNSPHLLENFMGKEGTEIHQVTAVFELRGPFYLDTWCLVTARLIDTFPFGHPKYAVPLAEISRLQPCLVTQKTSPITQRIHLACISRVDYPPWWKAFLSDSEHQCIKTQPASHFCYRCPISVLFNKYVDATSHTSNDVVAAQAECPVDISAHEFVTFGHLRSGGALQWINILQQVHSRALDFRCHDVHFLLAKAALQVGPFDLNTAEWEWHQELQELTFCHAILAELEGLLEEVSGFLQDAVMMSTIVLLLTRLLASTPCENVSEKVIRLLQRIRMDMLRCVQKLSYDVMLAPTKIERKDLLRDMAIVCRSTFDVDPTVAHKLFHSAEDICALLFCAILVRANQPVNTKSISDHSLLLLQRDRRLSLAVEGVLRDAIDADSSNRGVDLAVCNIWYGYRPGPRVWQKLQHPNSHWLSCETKAKKYHRSQILHLNLLDGTLLVDGRTIDGLPDEMTCLSMYSRIFGAQRFLVVPSDIPGMDFCTLAMICDHRVHFALRNAFLVVKAQYQDKGDMLEVIPHEELWGDLPAGLINDHIHWLNLSTSIIEIRPLKKLWQESSQNWKFDCRPGQYHLYKGNEWLVDMRSPTYDMISSRFKCLDVRENLIITTLPGESCESSPTRRLFVALPRYGISFFVNDDGELESRDFKSMVYDENQRVETLFGLETRLVLRPKAQVKDLVHRTIIIPDGPVSRVKHGHHVRVTTTSFKDGKFSTYRTYRIDTDLGCLSSIAGNWMGRLYLAHLHAMTSIDWMPDPLMGRTGAQQALYLLQSAGCRSLTAFDAQDEEAQILSSTAQWIYPQLEFAQAQIRYSMLRNRVLRSDSDDFVEKPQLYMLQVGMLARTAYLFPFTDVGPLPAPEMVFSFSWPKGKENDEVTHISLAVYHWLIRAEDLSIPLACEAQHLNTPWSNLDRLPPLIAEANDSWQKHGQFQNQPNYSQNLPSIAEVEALLQEAMEIQRFRLLFLLPAVIAGLAAHQVDPMFLSILIALAKQFPLKNPPCYEKCWPLNGCRPSMVALRECYANGNRDDPSINDKVENLDDSWPLISPLAIAYYAHANDELRLLLSRCYYNLKVREDLTRRLATFHALRDPLRRTPFQTLLAFCDDGARHIRGHAKLHSLRRLVQLSANTSESPTEAHSWQITLDKLLCVRSPPKLPAPGQPEFHSSVQNSGNGITPDPNSTRTLNQLLSSFQINSTNPDFQKQYITRLQISADEQSSTLSQSTPSPDGVARGFSVDDLWQHYFKCRDDFSVALKTLKKEIGPSDDPREEALRQSGQWPPITSDILLRCLASTSPTKLSCAWKKCLISLALLIVQLQRSRRLLWFALHGFEEELLRELENKGCDGWSAEEYPDWLLVQVQGNFVIRGFQADVALKMISPPSGKNTAMQVNMGEGKSSAILPICATSLADGNQLVRVIVPKPLMAQTLRLLANRLGGTLVNRPIYLLPFSRNFLVHENGFRRSEQVEKLCELFSECMDNHGILVVQSEHVLSLKLTSLERQLPKELYGANEEDFKEPADALLQLQKWVDCHSRDILDESDDILHPRFQLLYTIGPPQHMQGSPDRWVIIQQVLRLVRKRTLSLSQSLPDAIEYERNTSGSFPRIRILHASDACDRLILLITHGVMDGELSSFRLRGINRGDSLWEVTRDFIRFKDIDRQKADLVEKYGRRNGLWDGLLLLRGLLACNILMFALAERRWCVDYGLSPSRTKLAVPYRAKDTPALKAEFGHPDITIILTCLSYYYGGLTEEQLKTSFEILQGQDEPAMEYAKWLSDFECGSIPDAIKDLKNVNVKSSEQWDNFIFPLFFRNQGAVDFYLSRFVFPKETEEYPWKIGASSWDLVEKRERLITGFSGTNDGQYIMPTSIRQLDLQHQRGTDARVLSHLLQPENDTYVLISHPNGERRTIHELLQMFVDQKPRICVLLDVGAQILDLSNYQLAEAWLDLSFDSDGAVYFNDDDEPMVLTRDGACRPLVSSAFSEQLDRCVVYLDDAHTRGIDLKFPLGSRAAVTLGPKLTKDRLVQGCMRMRKLGRGHSVMFLAPLEVDRSIRAVTTKRDVNIPITVMDVVRWTIRETWADIQRRAPYWVQQGIDHRHRHDAWTRFCKNQSFGGEKLAMTWLQPERQSLADLYAPFQPKNARECLSVLYKHPKIKQRCKELGVEQFSDAQLEEQEREVHREVEREREVHKGLPKARPMEHSLHIGVVDFVKTGDIRSLFVGTVFRSVFTALRSTSAASTNARPWSPFVFATSDFCKTVKRISHKGNMDPYLRPVQWVLSGKWNGHRVLVVISPFEAGRLLPYIRDSKDAHLHLYTPRISKSMRPTDDLRLYSIPPLPDDWVPPRDLIDQLNVFAGQLWLTDYESYLRLCRFLRIQNDSSADSDDASHDALSSSRVLPNIREMFARSPLPFVRQLLLIRRGGASFSKTHMGRILQGERMTEEDFNTAVEDLPIMEGDDERNDFQ